MGQEIARTTLPQIHGYGITGHLGIVVFEGTEPGSPIDAEPWLREKLREPDEDWGIVAVRAVAANRTTWYYGTAVTLTKTPG